MIAKGKLVAFDTAENLEKLLLAPHEIHIVSDVSAEEVQEILSRVSHITDMSIGEADGGFTSAQLKTDCENVYSLSRAVFSEFSANGAALLEMSVKKANLEEVFIELTESSAADVDSQEPEETIIAETVETVEQEVADE